MDFSPQYCRDGVWDYQKDQVEIPNCQRELIHYETMMFQLSIILLYFKPGPSIALVLFILHTWVLSIFLHLQESQYLEQVANAS